MKKLVLASAVTSLFTLPFGAQAAETASPVTGNLGIFSNYIFRGVTQTTEKPAVQGGFDYAHSSGAYAGIWGSNVSWLSDTELASLGSGGPSVNGYAASSLELDVYGGYKGSFGKSDFGYDVGAIFYYYPGEQARGFVSPNTTEVYGALSWKWITAKLSYGLSEYFGFTDSEGTTYADVSVSYPIGKTGVTLLAHVGSLKVAGTGNDVYDYTDWKLGASYALPKDFTVGAYYADTNAIAASYTIAGKNWADNQVAVYVQKTF